MHATRVPGEALDDVWHIVAPMLDEGLAVAGEMTAADVRPLIESGAMQFWLVARPGKLVAVALTEIRQAPRRADLWVLAGAGEGADGVEALAPLLRSFAVARGCRAVKFVARRGWLRSGFLPRGTRHVADVLAWEV